MASYDYSISGIEDKFDKIRFHREIRVSLPQVLGVRVSGVTAYVDFLEDLSGSDETTLDNLFTAHTNFSIVTVVNRTSVEVLENVKSTDYSSEDWIIDPNLTALASVPHKYWKVSGDTVVEMNQTEKDVVDGVQAENNGNPRLYSQMHVTPSSTSLKVNVDSLRYDIGGKRDKYDGASDQSVTDDETNYIYLDTDGDLQINTTGFPTDESFIPLARVVVENGEIAKIYEERVLFSSSAAVEGTCVIGFPVDGGIRGGDSDGVSSHNGVGSLTFGSTGYSRNRWNFRPPRNYISGDLKLKLLCSVAGSPGLNSMRIGVKYQGLDVGDNFPASYTYTAETTKSLSGVSDEDIFVIDLTIPSANFDKAKDMEAMELFRDADHAGDTTSLTLHIHLIELEYTGYKIAGQAGQ